MTFAQPEEYIVLVNEKDGKAIEPEEIVLPFKENDMMPDGKTIYNASQHRWRPVSFTSQVLRR